ncbi:MULTISPECIES: hypothetical protein [Pseudoalteromonas]|uniref:hypothetical protein n=1 Tax=Pseudoalteromonas TaxID=53246 RepID=UPI0002C9F2EC|nr:MULTISPECIES: hypothetical protein [Pseudoalteromonas]ENN99304.1 hypothetical protein J139_07902 [Pseudoalteromonas agarivorans S816]TMS65581.1 hypothetical protein CWB83_12685 [Pseudoalteromonas sp. S1691]TMS66363.1 hypothetical protein CWB86_17820 [Pseudoalteromonas sp. S1731]TMS73923.1 hypothetical protein CWB88_08865 [Pseudoalteromonas sp. S1941]TMS77129.1 hypothetical protein CWB82_12540 [Pseudoalteromonas sp. S1690]
MTTTAFRKVDGEAKMASDSRSTMVCLNTNLPLKWMDTDEYLKTIRIDDSLYGFAGTNLVFKMFLMKYKNKESSIELLDSLVEYSKVNSMQFFIMRYDCLSDELRVFSYSPKNQRDPEIYKISSDNILDTDFYAIGSGKVSKYYKKYKLESCPTVPIEKIIEANNEALNRGGLGHISNLAAVGPIERSISEQAYQLCKKRGGDIFTGGKVNMSINASANKIAEQVAIMDKMDKNAKALGAVCASPIDAQQEVKQLNRLGHSAISTGTVEMTPERKDLFKDLDAIFNQAIDS